MSSNVQDLHKALISGAMLCTDLPLAVGGNLPFEKPADGAPWARASVLYNAPTPSTLGEGGEDAHDGILQVDFNFPLQEGTAAAEAAEAQLRQFMRPGRVLLYADTRAMVARVVGPRDSEVEGYFRRTMTVNWTARIAR